jgi:hypothetical protein
MLKTAVLTLIFLFTMGCTVTTPLIQGPSIPEIRIDAPPKVNIEIPFKIMKKNSVAPEGGALVKKKDWEKFKYDINDLQVWVDETYGKIYDFNAQIKKPVTETKKSSWKFWK